MSLLHSAIVKRFDARLTRRFRRSIEINVTRCEKTENSNWMLLAHKKEEKI